MSQEQKTTEKGKPTEQITVAPPSINLPQYGWTIRGMGGKFSTNPGTGTGSMTVPIATSPGRLGFGPQLSLSYDSGTELQLKPISGLPAITTAAGQEL